MNQNQLDNATAPRSVASSRLVRRVIAISTAGVANTRNTQCDHITTALCDDGSMWELRDNTAFPRWTRLPDICDMCGGLGEIGGITASDPGGCSEPCPECQPNDQVELPPNGGSESKKGVVGG